MNWLIGDWHHLLPAPWAVVALVLVSVFCGALIGAEREKKVSPAGLRTMILICLGATVFTMLSLVLAGLSGENGRVAAQIITGIAFLGAGAIIQAPGGVRGLTTAATIWAVAAIGMVPGAGYGGAGLALSGVVLLILTGLTRLEDRYLGPCIFRRIMVIYESCNGKTDVKIDDILTDYRIDLDARQIQRRDDDTVQLTLTYCNAHKHHKEFLVKFADLPEVRSISGDLG